MVWRSLRGDFKPLSGPVGGYAAFAHQGSTPVDHQHIARRPHEPAVTWLDHVTVMLQLANLNILIDPTQTPFAGAMGRFGAPPRAHSGVSNCGI